MAVAPATAAAERVRPLVPLAAGAVPAAGVDGKPKDGVAGGGEAGGGVAGGGVAGGGVAGGGVAGGGDERGRASGDGLLTWRGAGGGDGFLTWRGAGGGGDGLLTWRGGGGDGFLTWRGGGGDGFLSFLSGGGDGFLSMRGGGGDGTLTSNLVLTSPRSAENCSQYTLRHPGERAKRVARVRESGRSSARRDQYPPICPKSSPGLMAAVNVPPFTGRCGTSLLEKRPPREIERGVQSSPYQM